MMHDPNNPQCDKSQYGDTPDVLCTCDTDRPEDAPAPSTVVDASGDALVRQAARPGPSPRLQAVHGLVTLTGKAATSHGELTAAGIELQAAQAAYRRAEARWKAALDEHMAAILPEGR